MSTIFLSPALHEPVTQSAVVTLQITVTPAETQGFDRIQVFRSEDGPSGPYNELTSYLWEPARLPATGLAEPASPVSGGLVNVVGTQLELALSSMHQSITITFTGSNPLQLSDAADQIVAQGYGELNSYVDTSGQLVVETARLGNNAYLEVTGGDAAFTLQLPLGIRVYGRETHLTLFPAIQTYVFVDFYSKTSHYYKTRFLNAQSGAVSEFSTPYTTGDGAVIPPSNLIIGFFQAVTLDGRPIRNQEVLVSTEFSGTLIDGKLVTEGGVSKKTNDQGRAEFTLLRGQRITVAVPGTTMVRTITVPSDEDLDTFDLFDPTLDVEDVFKVNVPELVTAERRTL